MTQLTESQLHETIRRTVETFHGMTGAEAQVLTNVCQMICSVTGWSVKECEWRIAQHRANSFRKSVDSRV